MSAAFALSNFLHPYANPQVCFDHRQTCCGDSGGCRTRHDGLKNVLMGDVFVRNSGDSNRGSEIQSFSPIVAKLAGVTRVTLGHIVTALKMF